MFNDLNLYNEFSSVIGCDEVGRGPIAGPVNGCSVLISKEHVNFISFLNGLGVTDSKKLSTIKRKKILSMLGIDIKDLKLGSIYKVKNEYGECSFVIEEQGPKEIDESNILKAALLCMQKSSEKLVCENSLVLVDGNKIFPSTAKKIDFLIKGDSKSTIIALASIIAKEYRDELMISFDQKYPGFGLAQNAGYPTEFHRNAISKLGITPIHRKTFKGVKEYLEKNF